MQINIQIDRQIRSNKLWQIACQMMERCTCRQLDRQLQRFTVHILDREEHSETNDYFLFLLTIYYLNNQFIFEAVCLSIVYLCIYLGVYFSIYLSINSCICRCMYLCKNLFITCRYRYLSIFQLSYYLSIHLFIYVSTSIYVFINIPTYLHTYLSIGLCILCIYVSL